MDFTDYLVLETLARELNITTTAEKLYITQPALTYRIKSMEKELDTELLIRTPKGVLLTSEGALVVNFAKETLRRYNELRDEIFSMHNEVKGVVNVVVSPAFVNQGLPEMLNQFRSQHPNITIYIKSDLSSNAIDMLLSDKVHVGLIRGNHMNNLKRYCLCVDPIVLINKKKINLNELPNMPYIKYTTDITLERDIKNWWLGQFDFPPKTVMQINNTSAIREFVEHGLGFSILPSAGQESESRFFQMNLIDQNNKELKRESWLMYKENIEKIKAVDAFIQFVKKFYKVEQAK